MLGRAWRYRHFIASSVATEFRLRFVRSRFGAAWMVLNPLVQVAIYGIILSQLLSARLPGIDNPYAYALYLTAGMVAWSFFADIVTRCLTVFIDNGHLMKKVAFPRIALPLIALGTAGVNNLLLIVAGLVVFALLGHLPGPTVVLLPALAVLTAAFALGVGLVLGILNVFVRDIGQAVPLVLQILFWFTPVVYVPDILPATVRALLPLNPLYPIVRAYQDVLVFGRLPVEPGLIVVAVLAAGLLALALTLFRRAGPEMTDQL